MSVRSKIGALVLPFALAFSTACSADGNAPAESVQANQNNTQVNTELAVSTPQCTPLFQTVSGRILDASTSAHAYSQKNVGAVGISIFPGLDLPGELAHKYGTNIAQAFRDRGVDAECFVHNERHNSGSGVNYNIAGLSWKKEGSLNAEEATERDVLRGVLAEAKTAKALLAQSQEEQPAIAAAYD